MPSSENPGMQDCPLNSEKNCGLTRRYQFNELGKQLAEMNKAAIPKSPMGVALNYAIRRWDNLMSYLYDGSLEIDNNWVENAIRPKAFGQKNYLFAGSHNGAKRAAMLYSFIETCKKNNVNPYVWLKKVLAIISLDGNEYFIPSVPLAIPSLTPMV